MDDLEINRVMFVESNRGTFEGIFYPIQEKKYWVIRRVSKDDNDVMVNSKEGWVLIPKSNWDTIYKLSEDK